MDKHSVICNYNGVIADFERKETLTPATTRMDLEDVMLREVSHPQEGKVHNPI